MKLGTPTSEDNTSTVWESLQMIGKLVLLHRPYITLGFIAVTMLPLFNFASMGLLAYITYPILVLATFQVAYYSTSAGILGHGFTATGSETSVSKLVSLLFHIDSMAEEERYRRAHSSPSRFARKWGIARLEFLLFDCVRVQQKWQFLCADDASSDSDFGLVDQDNADKDNELLELSIDVIRIACIYASAYYTAVALAPIVVVPLHALLGFAGPVGLVTSYFLTLGLFYLGAYGVNQVKSWEQVQSQINTLPLAIISAVVCVVCASLYTPAGILPSVFSLPTLISIIAPVLLTVVALSSFVGGTAKDVVNNIKPYAAGVFRREQEPSYTPVQTDNSTTAQFGNNTDQFSNNEEYKSS